MSPEETTSPAEPPEGGQRRPERFRPERFWPEKFRLQNSAILWGAAVLLWLPIEDTHINWVLIFALLGAALAAVAVSRRRPFSALPPRITPVAAALSGGALVTPLALLLMSIKTGLHGHGAPDFTPTQVISVLQGTPVWIAGSLLAGIGWSVGRKPF